MDFRKILIAYADHVAEQEGTDFLPASLPNLSAAENAALARAVAEGDCGLVHKKRLLAFAEELERD